MYIHFYFLLNHDDTLEATDLTAETDREADDLATLETLDATEVFGAVRGAEDFEVELVLAEDELETFELVFFELDLELVFFELELEDPELVKGFAEEAEIKLKKAFDEVLLELPEELLELVFGAVEVKLFK